MKISKDLSEIIIGKLIPGINASYTDNTKTVIEIKHDNLCSDIDSGVVVAPAFFMTHDLIVFYDVLLKYGRLFIINHSETENYRDLASDATKSLQNFGISKFRLISSSMGIVLSDYLLQNNLPFVNYTTLGPVEKGANRIASTAASFLSWVGRKGPMGLFHSLLKIQMDGAPIDVQNYYKQTFSNISPEKLSRRFAIATDYINQKLSDNPVTTYLPTTAAFGERELPYTSYEPKRFQLLFPNSKVLHVPGGHTNFMVYTKEYRDAIIQGMENL